MIDSDAIAGRDVRHPDRIPLVPSGGLTAVRIGVQVRGAQPGDLDSLVALVLTARQEAGVGSQLCTDDAARLHDQLGTLLGIEGGRILLAQLDGEPAGLMLARIVGPGPFTDVVAMDIEAVYVQPDARRRGLGRALLLAAVAMAEEAGRDRALLVAAARRARHAALPRADRLRAGRVAPRRVDGRAAAPARAGPRCRARPAGSRTSSRGAGTCGRRDRLPTRSRRRWRRLEPISRAARSPCRSTARCTATGRRRPRPRTW